MGEFLWKVVGQAAKVIKWIMKPARHVQDWMRMKQFFSDMSQYIKDIK